MPFLDSKGYLRKYTGERGQGCVPVHRLVMEEHLSRKLTRGESIHHIDFDKMNNDISNLFLCNTPTHRKVEKSFIPVISQLIKKGLVVFNREAQEYRLYE